MQNLSFADCTNNYMLYLYLPCNSSAWRITAMDRTAAAGEHQMGRAHNQSPYHDLPSLTLLTYTLDSNLKSFEIHLNVRPAAV